MADFFQNGLVTTLHQLRRDASPRIEDSLETLASAAPIGLVLPALYSEFEQPAMRGIVAELGRQRYLKRIVVALGRANHGQFEHARSFFSGFETPVTFLQVDHPRVLGLFHSLEREGFPMHEPGKGRSCWLAAGYLLARGDCEILAFHDCDIQEYRRSLLARLCYPLAHPDLGFEYAKGYYARVSNQLHGRVTRLMFSPLVRALREMAPRLGYLEYLDSFRYALSGEFAMKASFARSCGMAADWALEIEMLSEAFDRCGSSRVCQVDIADNYEHKHQRLSAGDPARGLRRMATDIAKALLSAVARRGVALDARRFGDLEDRYRRLAGEAMRGYEADALVNGLEYDRHGELQAIRTFSLSLREAGAAVHSSSGGGARLPAWDRVFGAAPRFRQSLLDAVAETDVFGLLPLRRLAG